MMLVDMRAWLTAREDTVGPSRGGGRLRQHHVNASLRRYLGRLLRLSWTLSLLPRVDCGCRSPLPKVTGHGNAPCCTEMAICRGSCWYQISGSRQSAGVARVAACC